MNALHQAKTAYASPTAAVRTDRGTEYEALARVTRALRETEKATDRNFPAFAAAVHRNRQLWTLFAADVADDANALPRGLRAQIFYLAEFTDHQSRKVLRGDAGVASLIEINTAVMKGLRGREPAK